MNDSKDKKIRTRNTPRLVGVDNKPLEATPEQEEGIANAIAGLHGKDKIVWALRDLANRLEKGQLPDPDFIMLIPRFKNGDTSMLYFGDETPVVLVEGVLHRVLTHMAMGATAV